MSQELFNSPNLQITLCPRVFASPTVQESAWAPTLVQALPLCTRDLSILMPALKDLAWSKAESPPVLW